MSKRKETFRFFSFSEKEMNEKFLKRLEEDQEREMRQLEEKIRKQVRFVSKIGRKPTNSVANFSSGEIEI